MRSFRNMFKVSTRCQIYDSGAAGGQSGTLRVVTNSKTNANSFYSSDNHRFRLTATIAAWRGCRRDLERRDASTF